MNIDPAADGRRPARAEPLLAAGARDRRRLHDAGEGLAMKLKRHEIEVFSMSFLDCICCGFGAIILLHRAHAKSGSRSCSSAQRVDLDGQVAQAAGGALRDPRRDRRAQSRAQGPRRAALDRDATSSRGCRAISPTSRASTSASQQDAAVPEHHRERSSSPPTRSSPPRCSACSQAGYPRGRRATRSAASRSTASTSSSSSTPPAACRNTTGRAPRRCSNEILDIYPKVKGIQVMNDEGAYMFDGYRGQWIADTPARRKAILDALQELDVRSATRAPSRASRPRFAPSGRPTRRSASTCSATTSPANRSRRALDAVDRINRVDGRRAARAHPRHRLPHARTRVPQFGNQRFSALMRAMCERNGGTFVGLQEQRKT